MVFYLFAGHIFQQIIDISWKTDKLCPPSSLSLSLSLSLALALSLSLSLFAYIRPYSNETKCIPCLLSIFNILIYSS